jgi:hypothetical protein
MSQAYANTNTINGMDISLAAPAADASVADAELVTADDSFDVSTAAAVAAASAAAAASLSAAGGLAGANGGTGVALASDVINGAAAPLTINPLSLQQPPPSTIAEPGPLQLPAVDSVATAHCQVALVRIYACPLTDDQVLQNYRVSRESFNIAD